MKSKLRRPNLTDLIFEGRNKAYGAYEILKNSVRRLRISFFSAVVAFLVLIFILGGGIRLPWVEYSDEPLPYNTVNVKYDPTLITVLSEPFKVVPANDKQKVNTPPRIVDETLPVSFEEPKPVEDAQAKAEKIEKARQDSLNAIKLKPAEEPLPLTHKVADSVVFVDQLPQFPGGDIALKNFISNNVKYPVDAVNRKIQGTVILNFIVEKDGSIRRVIISKAVDPVLDFEAVRVISSMPHWKAASMRGKPIATMVVVPILFSLRP